MQGDQLDGVMNQLGDTMAQETVDWDLARDQLAGLAQVTGRIQLELDQKVSTIEQQTLSGSEEAAALLQRATAFAQGFVLLLLTFAGLAYWLVKRFVSLPVANLAQRLDQSASDRDLACQFEDHQLGEVGLISRALNKLFEGVRAMIGVVHSVSADLDQATGELNQVVTRANATVSQQMQASSSLIETMDEFSRGVEEVAHQAVKAE